MTSGHAEIKAASFKLSLFRIVTKAIPAAREPKAKAITIERVINKTMAVEAEAETPILKESLMHATIVKVELR